jgi:hypothetical protein
MKYQGTEDQFQMTIARYLDTLGVLWNHCANERKTSYITGNRLKQKGVKSGVPDILIFEPRGQYSGIAIELKVGYNKLSENQTAWLEALSKRGWMVMWSDDIDVVIERIDNYLNQTK